MSGTFGDIQIWESSATISMSTLVSNIDICKLESNNGAFVGTNKIQIATSNAYDGCFIHSSGNGFQMNEPRNTSKSTCSIGGLPCPLPTNKTVCIAVTPYRTSNYWNAASRCLYIFQSNNVGASSDAMSSFLRGNDVDWYAYGQEISSKSAATLLKRVDVVRPCEHFATGVGKRVSYTAYITGFTLYSDNKTKCDSLAVASIINQNADDLSVGYTSYNYPERREGSVVFDQTGTVKAVIAGNNVATVGSAIAQAMPHTAITASNTGIFATACMIAGDGTARHICRLNGLYRVYDGPKELIGEPGERINIGKHEFVYIMHSSYVFRIS